MSDWITQLMSRGTSIVTRIKSQAMAPLAWLCCMAILGGVAGLILGSREDRIFFMALITCPVLFYLLAYVFWSVKDPDRLGSEAFVERSHLLQYAERAKDPRFVKGVVGLLVPDPDPPPTHKSLPEIGGDLR